MTATRIAIFCSVAFALGAAAGGAAVWSLTSGNATQAIAQSAAAGVGSKTFILNAVRNGETEKAAHMLETLLDSDLVTLGIVPGTMLDPAIKRAITRAAAYRAKHPHKSDEPIVADAVARVLAGQPQSEPSAK